MLTAVAAIAHYNDITTVPQRSIRRENASLGPAMSRARLLARSGRSLGDAAAIGAAMKIEIGADEMMRTRGARRGRAHSDEDGELAVQRDPVPPDSAGGNGDRLNFATRLPGEHRTAKPKRRFRGRRRRSGHQRKGNQHHGKSTLQGSVRSTAPLQPEWQPLERHSICDRVR